MFIYLFIGFVIGSITMSIIKHITYSKNWSGTLIVDSSNPNNDVILCKFNKPLNDICKRKQIILTVIYK